MPTRVVPDVMLDLETWGRRPGCALVSAGLVRFDPVDGKLLDELRVVFSLESQKARKAHVDADTVKWWKTLPRPARKALYRSEISTVPMESRLAQVSRFLEKSGPDVRVWGNGADFDLPILADAYHRARMELPWRFWNSRCFRTYKNLFPSVEEPPREGTHHDALDDARHQARHALLVAARLKEK